MPQKITPERLSLLRCTRCGKDLREGASQKSEWGKLESEVGETCLECVACACRYPVTHDGIPIVWTDELRGCVLDEVQTSTAMAANISVYNEISSEYAQHWRQHQRNMRRLQSAAEKARPAASAVPTGRPLRHLDIGCGPGHVLKWLEQIPSEQWALDVSLANLRNVMRETRAFAVLGSADCLPFVDRSFDLVTESSALHHIEKWRAAVSEFARVCAPGGGVVIDSEPSRESKHWSSLATAIYRARSYPYHVMSHFSKSKFWFRSHDTAMLNADAAEIHNRPNTGLPVDEIIACLAEGKMHAEAIRSADEQLEPRARMSWQEMLLHVLSGHNPMNPLYGWFVIIARRDAA